MACIPTSSVPSRSNSTCSKRATAGTVRLRPCRSPRHAHTVSGSRSATARYACSGGVAEGFDSTIVALVAEDGTTGYGEAAPLGAFYAPDFPAGVRAGVAELLPLVIGADATAPRSLLRRLDTAMMGQPAAKSAIDMAACDLAARLAGVPLADALGGRDGETVELYRSVVSEAPADDGRARTRLRAATGTGGIQVKVGADPLEDAERLHAVREAVGPDGRPRVRRQRQLEHGRRAALPAGDARSRLRARAAVRVARGVRARPRALRSGRSRSTSRSWISARCWPRDSSPARTRVTIKLARVGGVTPRGAAARRRLRARAARDGRGHGRQRHRHRRDGARLALDPGAHRACTRSTSTRG